MTNGFGSLNANHPVISTKQARHTGAPRRTPTPPPHSTCVGATMRAGPFRGPLLNLVAVEEPASWTPHLGHLVTVPPPSRVVRWTATSARTLAWVGWCSGCAGLAQLLQRCPGRAQRGVASRADDRCVAVPELDPQSLQVLSDPSIPPSL